MKEFPEGAHTLAYLVRIEIATLVTPAFIKQEVTDV